MAAFLIASGILSGTAVAMGILDDGVVRSLLVPGLITLLPKSWRGDIDPYLPSTAGGSIFALHHISGTLSAGAGLAVLLGWAVLALGAAALRLVRSDA